LFSIIGLILTFGAAKAGMASLLALFVYMLEILVSFLQAYIFTMLSAMFIGQVYHPEH
jgi:F-type H+-transporting ATPase subunit a